MKLPPSYVYQKGTQHIKENLTSREYSVFGNFYGWLVIRQYSPADLIHHFHKVNTPPLDLLLLIAWSLK